MADVLTGSEGLDWFLFNVDGDGDAARKDKATDLSNREVYSDADLEFIGAPDRPPWPVQPAARWGRRTLRSPWGRQVRSDGNTPEAPPGCVFAQNTKH